MTAATFKFRELHKKQRTELKIKRFEIIEYCNPILENHAGNAVAISKRNQEFSAIIYSMESIADAYANAIANSKSREDVEYYGSLLMSYARYHKDTTNSFLILHFCIGLINEAVKRNIFLPVGLKRILCIFTNRTYSKKIEYVEYPD